MSEEPQPKDDPLDHIPLPEKPERPLECSECRRPITVWYTEVVGKTQNHHCMCHDCPVLHRRLGHLSPEMSEETTAEGGTGLCCGTCGTTLQAVRMGQLLGCSTCYEVFEDILLSDLVAQNKAAMRLAKPTRARPVHIGRSPGEVAPLNPSLRLVALNEALNETLSREDYEQAAWLRDQIKEITESTDDEEKE